MKYSENKDKTYDISCGNGLDENDDHISDKYLSITQIAKYRKISSGCLRYYDRIGLLKPDYVDPQTGRRYYSGDQCEKLGTIKELRKMNLSLQEIAEYFNDRNLEKSERILRQRYDFLQSEIKSMLEISRVLDEKLKFIDKINRTDFKLESPEIRDIEDRVALKGERNKFRTGSTGIQFMKLEETIGGTSPVVATNKVAMTIKNSIFEDEIKSSVCPVLFCTQEKSDSPSFTTIAGGKYVCAYHRNCYSYLGEIIMRMRCFSDEHGYEMGEEGLMIYQIDITLTDDYDETIIEIQFPLREKDK